MLEKLLLAAALTFTASLFSEANLSVSSQTNEKMELQNTPALTLTLRRD